MTCKEAFETAFNEELEHKAEVPMPCKDAFVKALDELGVSYACDKASKKARHAANRLADAKNNASKLGSSVSNPIGVSSGMQKTLAQHLQEGCKAQKPENCKYVKRMAQELEGQNMSKEEALQAAISMHSSPEKAAEAENPSTEKPEVVDLSNPDEAAKELLTDPTKVEGLPEGDLGEERNVMTKVGEVPVESPTQQAVVEALNELAKNGDERAKEGLRALQGMVSPRDKELTEKLHEIISEEDLPQRDPNLPSWQDDDNGKDVDGSRKETKVGRKTYVDVSNMPFWASLGEAWKAGWQGKDIVTDYMKVTGKWDKIRASAPREEVRSGIASALLKSEIQKHLASKDLSADSKMELQFILEELENAKTSAQKTSALRKYQKWQEKAGLGSSESNGFSSGVSRAMNDVHKDGGCATASTSIDENGESVTDNSTEGIAIPGAEVLGDPISANKAEIYDLEEKQKKLIDFINNNGVETSDVSAETSFNNTFIRLKVNSSKDAKKIEQMVDDLIGEVGGQVGFLYDAKTRTVVLSLNNDVLGDVSAKEIFESDEWKVAVQKMKIPIVIGKDMEGKPVIADLAELYHMLIGGETGQGKSVAVNTILTSIMMGVNPKDVKMVLIDPKGGAEFGAYEGAKHNLLPVAKDINAAKNSIAWVKKEMDNRAKMLNEVNEANGTDFKNIGEYNEWAEANGKETLPRIVVAIDELTELMKEGGSEFNAILGTLGNKARFTGIHLIGATQNPTKQNIGDVKDNFPARCGFHTTSATQSQNILGHATKIDPETGEQLIGTNALQRKGEFVFEHGGKRFHGQGARLGKNDVDRVKRHWEGKPAEPSGVTAPTEVTEEPAKSTAETAAPAAEAPVTSEPATGEPSETPVKEPSSSEAAPATGESAATTDPIGSRRSAEAIQARKEKFRKGIDNWRDNQLTKLEEDLESGAVTSEADYNARLQQIEDEHKARIQELETGKKRESTTAPAKPTEEEPAKATAPEEKEHDPFEEDSKPENRLNRLNKSVTAQIEAINKDKRMSETEKAEKKAQLQEQYKKRVESIKKGLSDKDILEAEEAERAEIKKKNEALKNTIRKEYKGKPVAGATPHVGRGKFTPLTPKEIKAITEREDFPKGWELDGDKNGLGIAYARNPENGSYGFFNPKTNRFTVTVDTTHPRYKGVDSDEAKAAAEALKEASGAEYDRLEKTYNNIAFGHDEAISARMLVACGIAGYLSQE